MRILQILGLIAFVAVTTYVFGFKRNSTIQQEGGLTMEEYYKKTDNKEKVVFVYFKADWCVPCLKLKPIMEQLAIEEQSKVEILTIDVDENPRVSHHFEINTLPLFILYKNGKKVWENNTSLPKSELQKKLNMYK